MYGEVPSVISTALMAERGKSRSRVTNGELYDVSNRRADKYDPQDFLECVTVTGCSRVSLEDANVAGIMVLDVEKKQLRSAPLGGEPPADDIEGLIVTDKAILIYGTGKRESDRTVSAIISLETGKLTAGISTLDSSISLLGNCSVQP